MNHNLSSFVSFSFSQSRKTEIPISILHMNIHYAYILSLGSFFFKKGLMFLHSVSHMFLHLFISFLYYVYMKIHIYLYELYHTVSTKLFIHLIVLSCESSFYYYFQQNRTKVLRLIFLHLIFRLFISLFNFTLLMLVFRLSNYPHSINF